MLLRKKASRSFKAFDVLHSRHMNRQNCFNELEVNSCHSIINISNFNGFQKFTNACWLVHSRLFCIDHAELVTKLSKLFVISFVNNCTKTVDFVETNLYGLLSFSRSDKKFAKRRRLLSYYLQDSFIKYDNWATSNL